MISVNKEILIISAVFPPEPVVSAQISYDVATKLSCDFPVVVLCPKPTRPNGKIFTNSDTITYPFKKIVLNSYTHPKSDFIGRMKESWDFGKKTVEYIKKHYLNIGCIYINTWPIFAQYLTLDIAKHYNIPTIIHIQDIYPESMLPRLGVLGRLAAKPLMLLDKCKISKATLIFAISENMRQYIIENRKISENKIVTIRNWQNDSLFKNPTRDNNKKTKKFTFMFAGSISPAAGIPFLINSFIHAELENARLIIAGDGSDKKICQDIANQHTDVDISFCSITPETIPEVQQKADVLLLPLKKGIGYTASPSKLPAYMFSSKPVLACVDQGSDTERIINNSQGGWVCKAENEKELIEKMREIIYLPNQSLIEKGSSARNYALVHFTKETNLNLIIDNIKKIYCNE